VAFHVAIPKQPVPTNHVTGFESRIRPLASRWVFAGRLTASIAAAGVLIGISLFGGMAGYHYFEGMNWIDAFVNASMILSGMGPVSPLQSDSGKIFAGCYALYSGLTLIVATGLIIAPVLHRVFHRFHIDDGQRD
jgi:hypothetical protein